MYLPCSVRADNVRACATISSPLLLPNWNLSYMLNGRREDIPLDDKSVNHPMGTKATKCARRMLPLMNCEELSTVAMSPTFPLAIAIQTAPTVPIPNPNEWSQPLVRHFFIAGLVDFKFPKFRTKSHFCN